MDALSAITAIVDYRQKKKDEVVSYLLSQAKSEEEKTAEAWRMLKIEEEAASKLRTDLAKLTIERQRSAAKVMDAVVGGRSSVEAQEVAASAGIAKEKIRSATDLQVAQLKHQEMVDEALRRQEAAASQSAGAAYETTKGLAVKGSDPNQYSTDLDVAFREFKKTLVGMPSDYARDLAVADWVNKAATATAANTNPNSGVDRATITAALKKTVEDNGLSLKSSAALADSRAKAMAQAEADAGNLISGVPGYGGRGGTSEFKDMAGPASIDRAAKIGVPQDQLPIAEAQAALTKLKLEGNPDVKDLDLTGFISMAAKNPTSVAGRTISEMAAAPWDLIAAYNDPLVVSGMRDLAAKEADIRTRRSKLEDTKGMPTFTELEDAARIMYTTEFGTADQKAALAKVRLQPGVDKGAAALGTEAATPSTEAKVEQPPAQTETKVEPPKQPLVAEANDINAEGGPLAPTAMEAQTVPPDDTFGDVRSILATRTPYDSLAPDDQKKLAEGLQRVADRRMAIETEQAAMPDSPEKDRLSEEAMDLDSLLMKSIAYNPDHFADAPDAPDYIKDFAASLKARTPQQVVAEQDVKSATKGIEIATEAAKEVQPKSVGDWKTVMAKQYGESKLIPAEIRAIFDYARRGRIPPDTKELRMDLMQLVGKSRWLRPEVQEQAMTLLSAMRALASTGSLAELGR